MSILGLRAARGWSLQPTAEAFLLTAATIASWMKRLDEEGPDALVQLREPVNKFSEFAQLPLIPLRRSSCRNELAMIIHWYNEHRPHDSLGLQEGCPLRQIGRILTQARSLVSYPGSPDA